MQQRISFPDWRARLGVPSSAEDAAPPKEHGKQKRDTGVRTRAPEPRAQRPGSRPRLNMKSGLFARLVGVTEPSPVSEDSAPEIELKLPAKAGYGARGLRKDTARSHMAPPPSMPRGPPSRDRSLSLPAASAPELRSASERQAQRLSPSSRQRPPSPVPCPKKALQPSPSPSRQSASLRSSPSGSSERPPSPGERWQRSRQAHRPPPSPRSQHRSSSISSSPQRRPRSGAHHESSLRAHGRPSPAPPSKRRVSSSPQRSPRTDARRQRKSSPHKLQHRRWPSTESPSKQRRQSHHPRHHTRLTPTSSKRRLERAGSPSERQQLEARLGKRHRSLSPGERHANKSARRERSPVRSHRSKRGRSASVEQSDSGDSGWEDLGHGSSVGYWPRLVDRKEHDRLFKVRCVLAYWQKYLKCAQLSLQALVCCSE